MIKFNRVDLLARDSKNELIIVEIQNTRELAYFQRMLYGTSKVISEYIHIGDQYKEVRKVYSINIVYFDLGQGEDYIYHGIPISRGYIPRMSCGSPKNNSKRFPVLTRGMFSQSIT